jgi:hypothetical protein
MAATPVITSCGRPRSRVEHAARLLGPRRLAEHESVDDDHGIRGQDHSGADPARDRPPFPQRQLFTASATGPASSVSSTSLGMTSNSGQIPARAPDAEATPTPGRASPRYPYSPAPVSAEPDPGRPPAAP